MITISADKITQIGHLLETATKITLKLVAAVPQLIYIKHVPLAPTNPKPLCLFNTTSLLHSSDSSTTKIYQPEVQKSPSDLVGCGTRPFPFPVVQ